jgi:hypothetical protein
MAVAKQRLRKYVSAAMNTHATTEELLDAVISMCPCRINAQCVVKGKYAISTSQKYLFF